METNDDLFAWTGMRNAPIAVLDDEPPQSTWHEILLLAERVGSGPSLMPTDPHRARLDGWLLHRNLRTGWLWLVAASRIDGAEFHDETHRLLAPSIGPE